MVAQDKNPLILVVEDVEETRDGIERLLKADNYRVEPAREEQDAILRAIRSKPDLILVSLGRPAADVILTAVRIRERGGACILRLEGQTRDDFQSSLGFPRFEMNLFWTAPYGNSTLYKCDSVQTPVVTTNSLNRANLMSRPENLDADDMS